MNTSDDQSTPPRPRPARPDSRTGPPGPTGRRNPGRNKKLANGLVALSTAAVMAVYGVGYARTAPAANSANADTAALIASISATATSTTSPATATAVPATATTIATTTSTTAASTANASQAPITTAPTSTRTAAATVTAVTASTTSELRDGTYTGTGTSRHGSIGVSVVIQVGKIVSADITNCGTRYPCSKIANLPGEVIAAQSANIDFVSGSTDSSKAYTAAVAAALAKAA